MISSFFQSLLTIAFGCDIEALLFFGDYHAAMTVAAAAAAGLELLRARYIATINDCNIFLLPLWQGQT